MSNKDQFEGFENAAMLCAVCEAMVPEAVDGTLTEAEQRVFEKHVAGCVTCSQQWEEAQRGAAWMAMLKGHTPEPPAALLQRILAETTGAAASPQSIVAAAVLPAYVPAVALAPRPAFGQRLTAAWSRVVAAFTFDPSAFQPRLAMTAAMAFFSIALTMNLLGVRVSDLKAGVLRPSTLQRTVATAGASATRSFQNLRVVYEVESRVSDLRSNGAFEQGFQHAPDSLTNRPATQESTPKQDDGDQPKQEPKQTPKPQGQSELQYPEPRYAVPSSVNTPRGA